MIQSALNLSVERSTCKLKLNWKRIRKCHELALLRSFPISGKIHLGEMRLEILMLEKIIAGRQDRLLESIKILSSEINMRLSQEIDSLMGKMNTQICY